ncbi:hypothetical protein UlMin_018905 [Ulmus minor]
MLSVQKLLTFTISVCYVLDLLPLVRCYNALEDVSLSANHKTVKDSFHNNLSPQMKSHITIHGLLLWVSIGFLLPAGIITVRLSAREEQGSSRAKVFFYLHVIIQMLSVLIATAGAIMSIRNFENSFNNNHQRIGLVLYVALYLQTMIGFLRPQRGKKGRKIWYFVHWMLGTLISLVGIINIYTGLQAYHKKTSRSTRVWTFLFTVEVSFIGFFYLFQDKKEHMQKQGVVLDNINNNVEATTTPDQSRNNINIAQRHSQKDLLPEPCGKRNALRNLFD